MKKIISVALLLAFTLSCKKDGATKQREISIAYSDSLYHDSIFEAEIDKVAIKVEGGSIKGDSSVGLAYSINDIKNLIRHTEKQLHDIENVYKYDNAELKESAKQSMLLTVELFKGSYCCLNHGKEHCDVAANLESLNKKFGCDSFIHNK